MEKEYNPLNGLNAIFDYGYALVIHTDKYAGNFEREMCAYITGVVSSCNVGRQEAKICWKEAEKEITDLPPIAYMPTERGALRPCDISEDEKRMYKNVVIFFEQEPNEEQIEFCFNRARKYSSIHHSNDIKVLKVSLVSRHTPPPIDKVLHILVKD